MHCAFHVNVLLHATMSLSLRQIQPQTPMSYKYQVLSDKPKSRGELSKLGSPRGRDRVYSPGHGVRTRAWLEHRIWWHCKKWWRLKIAKYCPLYSHIRCGRAIDLYFPDQVSVFSYSFKERLKLNWAVIPAHGRWSWLGAERMGKGTFSSIFQEHTFPLCCRKESAGHTVNTVFWVSLSRRYVPGRKWCWEAVGICDPATWREDNEGKHRHQRGEKHQHQSWSLRGQARPAPAFQLHRQDEQEFGVTLGYILSSKPVWATWDPVSQNRKDV